MMRGPRIGLNFHVKSHTVEPKRDHMEINRKKVQVGNTPFFPSGYEIIRQEQ